MQDYILYSSKDCCLCDDAMELLARFGSEQAFSLRKVNIYEDKSLLIKYRVKIPVLKDVNTGEELNWPFDMDSLRTWAEQ